MVKNEWQAHDERIHTDSNATHSISDLLQDLTTRGGGSSAETERATVRTFSWPPSARSGVDAQENDRTGERMANSGPRDGLRCGCGV